MNMPSDPRGERIPSNGDPATDASSLDATMFRRHRQFAATAARTLLWLAGAFTAATVCWIAWGIETRGGTFADSSRLLEPSLSAVGATGGFIAWGIRSRPVQVALAALSLACAIFWMTVPDDWWVPSRLAKPLPWSAAGPASDPPAARTTDPPRDGR